MITVNNYLNTACKYDFTTFPDALKKGDELTRKALNQDGYKTNETIKRVVDTYIQKLNAYLKTKEQKTEPKKPTQTKPKSESKPRVKKTAGVTKPPATIRKTQEVKSVEMIPEEIRFIKRYVAMHGKVKSKLSVIRLLSSLQKAMLEKRIRKTSPYAKEILQIQNQLISCADRMGEEAEISIASTHLNHYKEIGSSQRIKDSIALLKRFVAIHGREGMEERAQRLLQAMERLVKNGKISKDDPYATKLSEAYKSLKIFLRDKKKAPEIKESELNGIYGLLGISCGQLKPKKSNGLAGVVSSQDLMNMDFETIGLTGRFRELIGDPSVGFTAMVFGQPKSGKSTLMLDFAHYLAGNHGEVLYVAFEEGYGYTLKEKISRIGAIHPSLHFAEGLPGSLGRYQFVFIDSVSRAGMELEDMIALKSKYPQTSFIFIFHATKDGRFKGGNELAHEVDVIIEVENGLAKGKGRFGQGEMEVRF